MLSLELDTYRRGDIKVIDNQVAVWFAGSRLANNQVTCQDLLAYLLTLASKQTGHEASFFPSKQVVEALLACLLVGLVGWRFRRRIAGSMAKIANNKVHM